MSSYICSLFRIIFCLQCIFCHISSTKLYTYWDSMHDRDHTSQLTCRNHQCLCKHLFSSPILFIVLMLTSASTIPWVVKKSKDRMCGKVISVVLTGKLISMKPAITETIRYKCNEMLPHYTQK